MRKLLTLKEIAALANVKLSTVRAWVYRRKAPFSFIKVGGAVRVPESEVERWLGSAIVQHGESDPGSASEGVENTHPNNPSAVGGENHE